MRRGGEFCQMSVGSTLKKAEQHAKWITHLVKCCTNREVLDDDQLLVLIVVCIAREFGGKR